MSELAAPAPLAHASSSSLQSASLEIVYRQLNFSVRVPEPAPPGQKPSGKLIEKPILHGVTGQFKPGRFCAVMGASGSGKTSLLNIIAGRVLPDSKMLMDGELLINSNPVDPFQMRRYSSFCHQDDILMETQTIREAFQLSALLKLPKSMSKEAKLGRVEEVIDTLKLRKVADSRIGSVKDKTISGGERRRVSIGLELLKNSPILLLDEPSSGLDTQTALSTIEILSSVAREQGKTVVASIHQPSSDIFALFDDLLILHGGRTVYYGPAQAMVDYFSKLGYECPSWSNPADYLFMHILNKQTFTDEKPTFKTAISVQVQEKTEEEKALKEKTESAEKERLDGLLSSWDRSPENTQLVQYAAAPKSLPLPSESELAKNDNGWFVEFYYLSIRAWRNQMRSNLGVIAKTIQLIFFSLFVGLIFINVKDDQSGIQDRAGSLFFTSVMQMFGSMNGILSVFYGEKTVFLRETSAGVYSTSSYFFSRWVVEIPFKVAVPIGVSAIGYFMIGYQNSAERYWMYVFTLILLDNCGSSLGMWIAAYFQDMATILIVGPVLMLPQILFSGLYINLENIPSYFDWLSYLSPAKWGFISVFKNEFDGLRFYCTPGQLDPPYTVNGTCGYLNGADAERLFLGDQPSVGGCLGILLGLGMGFLLAAFWSLHKSTKGKV